MLHSQNRTNHPNASRDVTPSVRVVIYGSDGNSDTYITNTKPTIPTKLFDSVAQGFIEIGDVSDGDGNSALTVYRPGIPALEGEGDGAEQIDPYFLAFPGFPPRSRHTQNNLDTCFENAVLKKNKECMDTFTPASGYYPENPDGLFTKDKDVCGCKGKFEPRWCYGMKWDPESQEWKPSEGYQSSPFRARPGEYDQPRYPFHDADRWLLPVPPSESSGQPRDVWSPLVLDTLECDALTGASGAVPIYAGEFGGIVGADGQTISGGTPYYQGLSDAQKSDYLIQLQECTDHYEAYWNTYRGQAGWTDENLDERLAKDIKECMGEHGWNEFLVLDEPPNSLGLSNTRHHYEWGPKLTTPEARDAANKACLKKKRKEWDDYQADGEHCQVSMDEMTAACAKCMEDFGPKPDTTATTQ